MALYQGAYASIYERLRAKGARVTFTSQIRTHTPATGGITTTQSTVSGYAVQVAGNPVRYAALDLKQSDSPTLLCALDTFGEVPRLDAAMTWGGAVYSVKDVEKVAPDGTAVVAKLIVSR